VRKPVERSSHFDRLYPTHADPARKAFGRRLGC